MSMIAESTTKPSLCTHPDCFSCPYEDCRYEQMTIDEYMAANQRDAECQNDTLTAYKQRSFDCTGRKEYWRQYYQENREHKLQTARAYRHRTGYKSTRDRREYYKQHYQAHRAEKISKVQERNRQIREALNATG